MNSLFEALARDINDLRDRLDKIENKKTNGLTYDDLIDRQSRDYNVVRELYRHICGMNSALDIEIMCRYIKESYDNSIIDRDRANQRLENTRPPEFRPPPPFNPQEDVPF